MTSFSPCRSQYGIRSGDAGHRPVVVHDLADDAGRVQPREAREVDRRLRLAGALQDAAGPRAQREDVAGLDEVVAAPARVDRDLDRVASGRERRCRS